MGFFDFLWPKKDDRKGDPNDVSAIIATPVILGNSDDSNDSTNASAPDSGSGFDGGSSGGDGGGGGGGDGGGGGI